METFSRFSWLLDHVKYSVNIHKFVIKSKKKKKKNKRKIIFFFIIKNISFEMPEVFKSVFNVIVRCQSACQNKSMFRARFMEWYFLDPILKSYNSFMFKSCFQILKINAFSSILGHSNNSCKQTKNYNFFLSIHFEEYIYMTKK